MQGVSDLDREGIPLAGATFHRRCRHLLEEAAAALAGLGLVATPEWLVADALVAGQLIRVLEAHAPPSSGLYAVYPTNRLLAPRVRVFVDHRMRDLRAGGLPR